MPRYDAVEKDQVRYYHGTLASNLDQIRVEGLRPDAPRTFGISRFYRPGIFVTTDFDQAAFFACDAADRFSDIAVVLTFDSTYKIPVDEEQLSPDMRIEPEKLFLYTRAGWKQLVHAKTPSKSVLGCDHRIERDW